MYEVECYDSYGNSIDYLTQWDYNRKLIMYIEEYDLSITPEFHFCNKNSDEALVVMPTISGSRVTVDIPNILLQQPHPIIIYIYLTDAKDTTSEKTIITITLPVKRRVKPSDYVYVDNITKGYDAIILKSSTPGSTRKFKLTINDTKTISITEVV